jgi:peptidyl-prolyl cis-trans isomerase D
MATITKIRQNSGLVLIVIGLGMGAFILGDMFRGGGQRSTQYVGEIAGEQIEYIEYEQAVNLQVEALRSTGQNVDAATTDRIRNQVWTDFIRRKTVMKELKKAGIAVTQEEYDDLRWGDNVIPSFKNDQAFSPEGTFNPDAVKQYFKLINEQYPMYAQVQQNQIIESRETTKYYKAIQAGLSANRIETLDMAKANDGKISFQFVYKRLSTVPDSLIEITDKDLRAYFNEHKSEEKYKQNESRNADLVIFPVEATEEDKRFIRQDLEALVAEFEATDADSLYVLNNAVTKDAYKQVYIPGSIADKLVDSTLIQSEIGRVVGPYLDRDTYKIAKIVGDDFEKQARVRHILLRTDGTNDDEIKARADSIKRVIRYKRNFEEMVTLFSDDAASVKDGGVYDWFPEGRMVPEFNDASFNNRIGSIDVVKTTYGYHIVEVLGQRNLRRPLLAVVDRPIEPSAATYDEVYRVATDFSINYNTPEQFKAGADTLGYTIKPANRVLKGARTVSGFPNALELSKWMYNAELEEISGPIELEDQYVVALLTEITEEGEPTFEAVEDQFRGLLLTERKKAYVAAELEGQTDLAELASSLGLNVQTASNIPFSSSTIPGGGSGEDEVIGAAFTMEIGDVSIPMEGTAGVYVIELTDKQIPDAESLDEELFKDDLDQKYTNRVNSGVFGALREDAKVEDNRADFL